VAVLRTATWPPLAHGPSLTWTLHVWYEHMHIWMSASESFCNSFRSLRCFNACCYGLIVRFTVIFTLVTTLSLALTDKHAHFTNPH